MILHRAGILLDKLSSSSWNYQHWHSIQYSVASHIDKSGIVFFLVMFHQVKLKSNSCSVGNSFTNKVLVVNIKYKYVNLDIGHQEYIFFYFAASDWIKILFSLLQE